MFWRNERITSDLPSRDLANQAESSGGNETSRLSVGDVYFILFRQKWKIAFFALFGILAAGGVVFLHPPVYQSEAKLFIRYVVERKGVNRVSDDAMIRSPEARGGDILASEAEILTSRDLAETVAKTFGPERILEKLGGGDDLNKAAAVIRKNVTAEPPRNGSVIRVTFRHPDPLIVQPVLKQLIAGYLQKHDEIHRGLGSMGEFITKETDQLRSQLAITEEELQKVKSKAGVISLDETKRGQADQIARIGRELQQAEAELAGHRARGQELLRLVPSEGGPTNAEPTVPPEKIEEYQSLVNQLDTIRKANSGLSVSLTEESIVVKGYRRRITELEQKKREIEKEYPRLSVSGVTPSSGARSGFDPATEMAEVAAIQAKTNVLSNQLGSIRAAAAGVESVEGEINRLQRQKELQETNYRHFQANLEQKRFDEALGAGRDSSISEVQTPTPPVIDPYKTTKYAGLALAGGLFGGIGFAFLIERVLDRRVKRSADVLTKLRLPLLLNIPYLKLNGKLPSRALLPGNPEGPEGGGDESTSPKPDEQSPPADRLDESADKGAGDVRSAESLDKETAVQQVFSTAPSGEEGEAEVAFGKLFRLRSKSVLAEEKHQRVEETFSGSPLSGPEEVVAPPDVWQANSKLRPYHEALRDRMIIYFEARDMKRKPKLVAVSSCGREAGVSSIAAGLAAALSETGDGKVLLVDMNLEKGMAHPFYDGRLVVGMSEALDREKRDSGLAQSNLCLATVNESGPASSEGLPSIIPRRFARWVPRLKASDYDYIIFDMPPVDHTSVTPRLSGLMDLVLMVLESEKTGLDAARQANSMLEEVKASVAVVLNKSRKYVPAWLSSDL